LAELLLNIELRPPARDVSGRFMKASANVRERQRNMLREVLRKGVSYAQDEAPKGKTGRLKAGIRFRTYESGGTISGRITSAAPYTPFVVRGTRPHVIYGRPLLAFEWKGKTVIVRFVHHPGTTANPFMARALARLGPDAIMELRRVAAGVIQDLRG